jgi:hypothetical protein
MLEKWSSKGLELIKYMQTVRMAATMPKDGFNMMSARPIHPPPHGVWWMLLVSTPKTTPLLIQAFRNNNIKVAIIDKPTEV